MSVISLWNRLPVIGREILCEWSLSLLNLGLEIDSLSELIVERCENAALHLMSINAYSNKEFSLEVADCLNKVVERKLSYLHGTGSLSNFKRDHLTLSLPCKAHKNCRLEFIYLYSL